MDGLRHSSDGGDTWETVPHQEIPNMDIHNVTVTAGPPHRVVVMVNDDVFLSDDDGGSWRNLDVRQNFPLGYPRGIKVKADDPQTIFTTFGDTTPGVHRTSGHALHRRRSDVEQPVLSRWSPTRRCG